MIPSENPRLFRLFANLTIFALAVFFLASGCRSNTEPNIPAEHGALQVFISLFGVSPGNFTLSISEQQQEITPGDTLLINELSAGSHLLELIDIPENCEVDHDNPLSVTIEPEQISTVHFEVSCSEIDIQMNSLIVSTQTSGNNNGYLLKIDDENNSEYEIEPDGSFTIEELPQRDYRVELTGIPYHCTVEGENPQNIDLSNEEAPEITFYVQCQTSFDYILVGRKSSNELHNPLFSINPDGSNAQLFNSEIQMYRSTAILSPDNNRIAISGNFEHDKFDHALYLMDKNGSNTTLIYHTEEDYLATPEWSPDGGKLLFVTYHNDTYDIFTINTDGTNLTNLTANTDLVYSSPTWSPDGSKISFSGRIDSGLFDIYIMNNDGTEMTNITNDSSKDFRGPVWSPDGNEIAFTLHTGDRYDIYKINSNASGLTNITGSHELGGLSPNWSPDGNKIAYNVINDPHPEDSDSFMSNIYVMDKNGSNPVNVTNTGYRIYNQSPGWSPDGKHIAFNRTGHFIDSLPPDVSYFFIVNADGTGALNLKGYEGYQPVWIPAY